MRAMSENADSARLSGVWIRRTSTLTWTVAGALSAFTAILNAPGQTSALTQVLSPDLLLFALTAALVGAMINLTVAFVAGIGVGVLYELLQWNITSTANQQLVLFLVLLAVLLIRAGALRKGSRTGERSTWLHGAATVRGHVDTLRNRVSTAGVWAAVVGAALLPLVLNVGNSFLFSQVCIYAVIALSLTVLTGWAGQVSLGAVRAGGGRLADGGSPGQLDAVAATAYLRRAGDRPGGHLHRPAGTADARPLPGRQHPGLRHLHADVGPGHPLLHRAGDQQGPVHGPA